MKAEISDSKFINQYLINCRWYLAATVIMMRMWEDIVMVCFEVPPHSNDENVVHKLV